MHFKYLTCLGFLALLYCSNPTEKKEITPELADPDVEKSTHILPSGKDIDANNWLEKANLVADFNSDGNLDTASTIMLNNKKGIKITHGKSGEAFILGAGNKFGNGGDDFDWVTTWHLVTAKSAFEVTFNEDDEIEGTREVKLDHPSFYIGDEVVGGATITWKNDRYIWIHQAD